MLRKLYIVPAEVYRPSLPPNRGCKRPSRHKQNRKIHLQTEWIKLRTNPREAALRSNGRTLDVADYMEQIMPAAATPPFPSPQQTPTHGCHS